MVYLDYNSTHPPNREIITQANQTYLEHFANSSGLSAASQKSNQLVEDCREQLAQLFQVKAEQIIFTSSASEANGLIISALAHACKQKKQGPAHILTNELEHPSISESVKKTGAEIFLMPVTNHGNIDLEKTLAIIETKQIDFCTLIAANNETGIVQPIAQLAEHCQLPIVCDAVQLLARMSANDSDQAEANFSFFTLAQRNNVFFTLAGHKVGAGFGAGMLIRPNSPVAEALADLTRYGGGSQEYEIRAGSHNLAAILAFTETLKQQEANWQPLAKLTAAFEGKIKEQLAEVLPIEIIGQQSKRIPGTSLISFKDVPIDFFLMGLDKENIIVSTGTSCKSRSRTPSLGLLAMGLSEEVALSVIRFSYDLSFTDEIQDQVIAKVKDLVVKLL